jgi:hypothetical protein
MYRSRLTDVLREDYPRVAAILGDEQFSLLTCRYLARHPSTHPSVRHVGRHFADWLPEAQTPFAFLPDLARLEWARVEVFDAPDTEPLRLSDLEPLPAAEWPEIRLRLVPACAVVESDWPVHELWAAAERDRDGDRALENAARAPSAIRVWREDFRVSHAAMGPAERRAFPLLQRGRPFAEICSALEGNLDADAAARQVGEMLLRWLEDGLIARPT